MAEGNRQSGTARSSTTKKRTTGGRKPVSSTKVVGARERRAMEGKTVQTRPVQSAQMAKRAKDLEKEYGKRPNSTSNVSPAKQRRIENEQYRKSVRNSRKSTDRDYETAGRDYEENSSVTKGVTLVIVGLIAILCFLSYIGACGSFGSIINDITFGFMGSFAYVFPFALVGISLFAVFSKRSHLTGGKIFGIIMLIVCITALIQLAASGYNPEIKLLDNFTNSAPDYEGQNPVYGGLLGGILCNLLCTAVGDVATAFILVALVLIILLLLTGNEVIAYIKEAKEERDLRKELEREQRANEPEPDYYEERDLFDDTSIKRRRLKFRSPIVIEKINDTDDEELEELLRGPGKENSEFVDSLRKRGKDVIPDRDTQDEDKVRRAAIELEEIGGVASDKDSGADVSTPEGYETEESEEELYKQELRRKYGGKDKIDLVKLRQSKYAGSIRIGDRNDSGIYIDDPEEENEPFFEESESTDSDVQDLPSFDEETSSFEEETQEYDDKTASFDEELPSFEDKETQAEEKASDTLEFNDEPPVKQYEFPPMSLLKKSKGNVKSTSESELNETARKLEETFESFGVGVTVTDVSCGPSVTRFELHPEQGVKVSRITALADDIKLNLAAADIRIEAPIPGKAAVGIEIPNKENQMVLLRDLLENDEFLNHKSNIAFAVGKDIGGKTIVTDIAKMPHLLIAGATGSGKSVCINTLIMSIIYKAKPTDVKLIMVDPKVVELSVYNGIPHLMIPVVTDPKKASAALNWAVMEMTNRYKIFADAGVRDLAGYNHKVDEELLKPREEGEPTVLLQRLPQIVIIVDELADLMMVAPGEVEDAICRLAQLARAAGIHLVIATQRPSVNVITGLIKANVPSRIAFAVSSAIDSRTIIDSGGAEKLLGRGDMLFFPSGYPKPVRLQGAFVSDKEVSDVVDFLKNANEEQEEYNEEITKHIENAEIQAVKQTAVKEDGNDEYFAEAGRFIIEKEKASIGLLQRVYKIGFNRAARIMDQLAEAGVVGPEEGTKPRKILMTMEEFEEYVNNNQ